jgi:putative acetyltransferase
MTSDAILPPSNSRLYAGPQGLLIRAARHDDCEKLATLVNMPGFRAGTLRLPYQTIELTRKWLERQNADALNIVAVLDGEVIGQAGLDRYSGRRAHAAGLVIGVHDDHQGKGIGTALMGEIVDAADNWLGLKRLELTVYTDNAPAIRLYKKFGFEPEGIRRAFAFKAGNYVDALSMARVQI